MKKPAQHLIAEALRRQSRVEMTISIDLGDVWSHYCTHNEEGEVVDRSRFLREEIRLCSTSLVGPRTEDSNLSDQNSDLCTQRFVAIRPQTRQCVTEKLALEDQPAEFVARFWHDFHRSMVSHTVRSALGKLLMMAVGVLPWKRLQASFMCLDFCG